jgi:hypothetical protein
VGNIRKKKNRLIQIIDELDIKAELTPLDFNERQIKKKADEDLAKLRQDEETKWAQSVGTPDYPSGISDMHTIHDPMISVS